MSDKELEAEVRCELLKYAAEKKVTDRGIEKNDVVTIRYTIYQNDTIFEGYENIEEYVCVGNYFFQKDIEKKMIGRKVGDILYVDVEFPEQYDKILFAGKRLTFQVEIIEDVYYQLPELTETFLTKNYNMKSKEELYKYVEGRVMRIKEAEAIEEAKSRMLQQIIEETVFDENIQQLCDDRYKELMLAYEDYADLYDVDIDDVLVMYDLTDEMIHNNAEYDVKSLQICKYICAKEGLVISNRQREKIEQFIYQECGYENVKQYVEDNGKHYLDDEVMIEFVSEYIYNHASITEK